MSETREDEWLNDPAFMALMQPGKKLRLFFQEGNPNNATINIRALVDEDEIVYRSWLYRKQHWGYRVDWIYMFWLYYKDGHLSEAK